MKWGVRDALDESYNENLLGARHVVPKILNLFKQHRIKATWAIVGFLFRAS